MKNDTIAAISTGQVPAGIAVIRISGPDSIGICNKVFKSVKPLNEAFSHTVIFGDIMDGTEKLDEVLATVFRAPGGYTGEDTVEISCHGSLLIQKKILSLLIKNGARLAEPGEFTMRAFLNGKMDLSSAEAVMEVIHSENDLALKASMASLSGNFSACISEIRQEILHNIAFIETALDDPEHFSLEGYPEELKGIVERLIHKLSTLVNTASFSNKIKQGITCGIVGGVNVGKSSLLNALCGEDRAIVTDIPGTTRDTIDCVINMGNFTLNVIDTAGIRDSLDSVENIGIKRSKKLIDTAELLLMVVDSSRELDKDGEYLLKELANESTIIVLNKSDLEAKTDENTIRKYTERPIVSISAKKYSGIEELKEEIEKFIYSNEFKPENATFIANDRHIYLMKNAMDSLGQVINSIDDSMTEEIFAVDLNDAYMYLGKILGLEVGEDVINEIFSKFCVGK